MRNAFKSRQSELGIVNIGRGIIMYRASSGRGKVVDVSSGI